MKNYIELMNRLMDKEKDPAAGSSGYGDPDAKKQDDGGEDSGDDNFDDYGYETDKSKDQEGEASNDDDKEESKDDDQEKEVEKKATGYDKEPEKVEEDDAEDSLSEEDEKKDDGQDDAEEEIKLKTEGLEKEQAEEIQGLAKELKLSKEQAQKLVDREVERNKKLDKSIEEQRKAAERRRKEIRAKWHKELKEDSDFGGANFDKSVHKAERVLEDFFPNMKKELTESGAMLPPYVMRDLAKLAESLYAKPKFQSGDAAADKSKDDDESDDPLAFYE